MNSLAGTRCLGGAAATLAGRSRCFEYLNNCTACRSMFVDRHIRNLSMRAFSLLRAATDGRRRPHTRMQALRLRP